jgi:mRNA deadenylase 3'-5' endonuclease subunit Ccr4
MKQEGYLLGRTWGPQGGPGPNTVGLAQFNCLADSLHDAFPRVDKSVLVWHHRRPLLLAEIGRFVDAGLVV